MMKAVKAGLTMGNNAQKIVHHAQFFVHWESATGEAKDNK